MWTRAELKERTKASLKRNYWKTVLVAMLAMAVSGVGIGSTAGAALLVETCHPYAH